MTDKNVFSLTCGKTDTSKGISLSTLQRLADLEEVSCNELIQSLLVRKFCAILPDDYELALVAEKANEATDELSLKQFFKALIENALVNFANTVNFSRMEKYTFTYDKNGFKVVLEFNKTKGKASECIASISLPPNRINKELLASYKKWMHNQITIRYPLAGMSRAKVINDAKFSDIAFGFKY